MAELLAKNGQLKTYANELKENLEAKYSEKGEVMPRELQEAPVALSPRNERSIGDQMKESQERRDDILNNGRLE